MLLFTMTVVELLDAMPELGLEVARPLVDSVDADEAMDTASN